MILLIMRLKNSKKEENKFDPSDYSCEILLEKTTKDKAEDKKFPSDAYIITYIHLHHHQHQTPNINHDPTSTSTSSFIFHIYHGI